jgi:hypothetical protein
VRDDQDPLRIAYDVDRWQRILNAHPIPPRRSQHDCWVPVVARVAWERDGVERLETHAFAWTHDLVLVQLLDTRYRFRGAWLAPADVERTA